MQVLVTGIKTARDGGELYVTLLALVFVAAFWSVLLLWSASWIGDGQGAEG
jgi:hypothetical protein